MRLAAQAQAQRLAKRGVRLLVAGQPLQRDAQVLGLVVVGEGDVDVDTHILRVDVAVAVDIGLELHEIGRAVVDDLEAILAGLPPRRMQQALPELIRRR